MKRLFRVFGILAVLSGLFLSQIGTVDAQSNALAISPRKDYNLEPGESVTDTLNVTNRNPEEPLNLKLSVVDFQAENESGAPQLMRKSTQRTAWSLKNYIDMPEQVTVGPGATVRIPISVSIPKDAGAGSYYSAIEYAAIGADTDSQVNISASSITLMFVKVPGQARQQLTFLQFGSFRPDLTGLGGDFVGLFFNERPKSMAYRLKNDGNIAEQPVATIIVRDFSGKEVYTIKNANPKAQLALRGQTRRFDSCINPEDITQTTDTGADINAIICGDTNFKPGRYTAELTIIYGDNGNESREISAKTSFWYLPWWYLGVILLGVMIIAGLIYYVVRRVQNVRSRKTRRR